MAVNPMQRKANNSFLLGIVITLLITGIIIGLLILQISKLNKEKEAMKANRVKVYVLNADIKSGEMLTSGMLKPLETDSSTIPANAITAASGDLSAYSLCDKDGNEINLYYDSNSQSNYYAIQLPNNDNPTRLIQDRQSQNYYYEVAQDNGEKARKYVEFQEQPIIAKIDLNKNTLLTSSNIKRGELVTADVRTQEYNIITLMTQLQTGDFVDIRLRLPNGQDVIVASHKKITFPQINGVDSTNCIWVDLTETETLTMSCAIVEAYKMEGAKLYATKYVEAGYQDAAIPTYLPNDQVIALMAKDPNAVQEAKNALFARNNDSGYKSTVRNPINDAVKNEKADDNLNSGVRDEIQSLQEEREQYLESLGG